GGHRLYRWRLALLFGLCTERGRRERHRDQQARVWTNHTCHRGLRTEGKSAAPLGSGSDSLADDAGGDGIVDDVAKAGVRLRAPVEGQKLELRAAGELVDLGGLQRVRVGHVV